VPAAWLEKSRKHLIKTTAQCRSAEDVAAAVQNGYPCTIASNWGGQMRPSVQGDRLINKRATTWNHQMCVVGWEDHASLGELFYILNSWGVDTHGTCPSGAPPGGFWIRKADMQNIVGQEETFALSQFDGFPSQDFFWLA
jgi:C1A family cysteine protease